MAVLLGLLPVVQLRAPAVAAAPAVEPGDSRSVAAVGVRQAEQDPDPDDESTVTEPLPAGTFPAGGEVVLDLQADAEQREAFGLTVQPAEEAPAGEGVAARLAGGVGSVRVRSFDRSASVALGNAGPLYSLARADGSASAGSVQVAVDYSDFAQAYGGSFADRLTLVRLPGCAATTPQVPECSANPVWVSATNDPHAKTLTAVVDVAGDSTAAGSRTGVFAGFTAQTSVESVGVYALASSASGGSTGSYTATDLQPSGSWQVGESAGSFTYSYPLPEPPLPYGQTLGLQLSYSSSAVDGMTHGTNNQSGPAGLGWSYSPGYVERMYKPCRTHPTEMCWESPDGEDGEAATNDVAASHITISLQGQSTQIVKTTAGVWKPVDDLGWRVEFLSGGAESDGYWKVWTQDGTEYRFGYERESVWKMSFLGDEDGEPCHDVYPASCRDPWRWNLDRVRDANENETYLHWTRETNHYKRALSGSILEYERGGYLSSIEYAKNVTEAGAIPVGKVVFGWAHRCVERTTEEDPFNNEPPSCPSLSSNPTSYPDVPGDLICGSSSCGNYTQSFFTARILDRVTSYQWNAGTGAWNNVGRVQLRYKVLNPPGITDQVFILDYIRPIGLIGADANKIDMPPVNFDYVDGVQPSYRDGRVDYDETGLGVSAMRMPRLLVVRNGLGGRTEVTYGNQKPCPQGGSDQSGFNSWHNGKQGNWDVNTEDCYPIFHSPPGAELGFGIFHKYLVKKVVVKDQVGGSPDQVTQYDYSVGNPAWKNPNNPLVPDANESWSIFAGYNRVRVVQGSGTDPSTYTVSMSRFFRGMYHDIYDPGSGGGIKETTVTDWAGNVYHDHYARAGRTLQTRQYRMTTYHANPANASYTEVASTRYDHIIQGSFNGPGYANPRQTRTGLENHRVKLDDGTWRHSEEKTVYESTYGLPIRFHQYNEVGVADNTCTSYTYAQRDVPSGNYLISFPERVETWSGDTCGSGTLLSRSVTFYDTYTAEGSQTPFDGNVAETRVYTNPTTYTSSGRRTYDNMGRLRTATDPAGLTTTVSYSPVVNWPDNGTTSTVGGGFNHSTTTLIDRHTGQPSRITDPNGKITDLAYDPVGRLAEVYLPGQAKSTGVPSLRFSYHITSSGAGQPTAPARTRTETLQSHNGSPVYLNSYQYVDGLGRARETQQPGPNGGRVVVATTYDARGNVAATTAPFHNSSAAGSGLVNPSLATVPATHETRYDHLNRSILQIDKKLGTAWRQSATTYYGDRVMVVPPAGGTKTVSHLDVRGNVTRLDQFNSATNPNAYQSTTYVYDLLDQLNTVADPAGNTWIHTYDLAGRPTQKTDPDAGTSSTHYDAAGRLSYTIDGRGQKNSVQYDGKSRVIGRWAGDVGTGTRLVTYVYDSIAKGQLTSSIRHDIGGNYTTTVTGYTDRYQPTGTSVTIPAAEGVLAGTYTSTFTYDKAGHVTTSGKPAMGGLPAETLTFGYDNNGYPTTMTGVDTYVTATSYYAHGPTHQLLLGATGKRVRLTQTIDQQTGRLDATSIDLENTPDTFTTKYATGYRYDAIGNVTSILGSTDGTADQIECFRYDPLRRLTTAWTGNTPTAAACDQTPQRGGSIDPYWRSWQFDAVGNRIEQTDHNPAGNTTWTYTHPNPGTNRPHAVTSITATGPLATTPDRSFTHDNAGNTLTRHTNDGVAQQLTWDAEGRLDTLTEGTDETTYIYDTEGNRLISRAPDKTTLYLGATELTLNAGATQTDGTRYYSAAGATIAVRTHTGLVWSGADHHGTEQIQINADNLTTTRKRLLPYGEDRTTPASIFLGTRGFVGGTQDPTGLIHLGAREYDPTIGAFISVDPIQNLADPQQWNGYSYANNNPTSFSDASGLYPIGDHGGNLRDYSPAPGNHKVVDHRQPHEKENPPPREDPPPGGSGKGSERARKAAKDAFLQTYTEENNLACRAHRSTCAAMRDAVMNGYDPVKAEIQVQCGDFSYDRFACMNSLGWEWNCGTAPCPESWIYSWELALAATDAVAIMATVKAIRALCSFSPETRILLADGTTKPISHLRVGDEVYATDPETGETGKRRVTHVWVHEDNLHTLTIDGATLNTTEDHPFWNATDREWQRADALQPGDQLASTTATPVQVTEAVPLPSWRALAYNLTVDELHTYYVLAGGTPVLVHNTGPCGPGLAPGGVKNLRDGAHMSTNDALDTAVDFLGPGYQDMGGGRFLSRDGLRQVRMTDADLAHPRQNPHINFETYNQPIGPGVRSGGPASNIHIYLPEEPGWHLP
ncbi:polymorphic toxin-type HINT domain-containing protein [Micromonospora sp. LOL_024]|uniref:polymorphic toxin-type HINT domain-containing protein n=1 Tax=Micromonospora sp. LOL_024 TaxID=3345412 RepID=UPI003A870006